MNKVNFVEDFGRFLVDFDTWSIFEFAPDVWRGSSQLSTIYHFNKTLRENCSNTEYFLVHIFQYSGWIQSINPRIQSEYRKKYRPEKTPYLDTFCVVKTANGT